ncbi:unnamed protein product [Mytilus edulis]|uniref:Uncharacterized protein n=1 Tax=Mytilus edulis TaxID=6550 RepID=A0A8S3QD22_MYTED|nr:unnamed protein product [Mytilus edulis]
MPSKVPKRSNRKRKSTQRLGEVMENIGSSDLGVGVSIDNPVPSSSNPNNNSGQLSADNPHVQSNPIDPNTYNDDQILRILTVATPIITQTVVTILKRPLLHKASRLQPVNRKGFIMLSTMNQAARQEFVDTSTPARFAVETTAGGIANNPNTRTPILTPPIEGGPDSEKQSSKQKHKTR